MSVKVLPSLILSLALGLIEIIHPNQSNACQWSDACYYRYCVTTSIGQGVGIPPEEVIQQIKSCSVFPDTLKEACIRMKRNGLNPARAANCKQRGYV